MEGYSDLLFNYAQNKTEKTNTNDSQNTNENNNNSDDNNFETPPLQTRNVYADITTKDKHQNKKQTQQNSTEITPYIPQSDDNGNSNSTVPDMFSSYPPPHHNR